ncbi:MAG: PKD domain-containing protein [Bacteroidota bacterium]
MIKTTKYYIVVFLALLLAPLFSYSQYNGGSGSGTKTDDLGLTSCTAPPQFYAYFGGTGNLIQSDMVNYTSCSTPPQFFAYMGGSEDGAHVDQVNLTTCSTPPQFFAYMGGGEDGSHADAVITTTCSTPAQFFAYMGGAQDGLSVATLTLCSTSPPVANFSANSTTVCAGSSISFSDLSLNSPNTWSWAFAGGTPSVSTTQNPNVTYNTPGVYNVTLTVTNAHGSNTAVLTNYITVNALPFADAGNNTTICNGNSTVLNASGGTSYSWTPSTGLSSVNIQNPIANPTVNTTYTVIVTNNGCTKTDPVTISVTSPPIANAGADVNVCLGSTATLNASGGTSYLWSPATGLSSTTISNPVVNTTVTATYTVVVSNSGCSNSDIVVVNVNTPPVADAGTNTIICRGSSTTLNASGGTSYTWTPSTSLNFPNSINPVASPTITTNYTVAISNGTCTANDVVTVSVTPLPIANAGSDVTICSGASTTLSASGGTGYNWSPSTGLSSATIANPVANPTVTTDYTVTVTNNGCSSTDVVNITITTPPTVNAGSDINVCFGSAGMFNASGGTSYLWSPATGLSSTTVSNPIVNTTVTATYTVLISNGGCSGSDQVTVNVNALPLADAGTNAAICLGNSTTLNASGGVSYTWTPSASLNFPNSISPVANPTITTTYTVAVSNGSCTASDVVTVSVTPLPNANAGSDVSICSGASTTLSASGGISYNWAPSTGLSSTTIFNPVASPTVTTDYTVTVTNNGCTSTDVVNVTIGSTLIANAGTSTVICNGQGTILNATGGTTYSWSPSTGLSSTTAPNPSASPVVTTVYTVTVSSGACTATDNVTVTVNPTPTVVITASGPTTFCAGGDVILTASAASSYIWSNGANTASISVVTSGNYYVTVANASGCTSTSAVTAVTVHTPAVTSISPSGATTFCNGGSVLLSANSGSGYHWSSSETVQTITVTTSGTYSVLVDDPNGCTTTSASISVSVNPNPSVPVITAGGATSICIGDTVKLYSDAADHYLWSTGATTYSLAIITAGTYSVTNYNSFGCGTTSSGITVAVNDPLADFTGTPTLVFIPNAVTTFTANTTGFPPYTYNWNFGDGGTSALAAPTHTYNVVAFRTVSLTVTDNTGCSKTIVKPDYIEVEQLFPSTAMTTGTSFDITGVSFVNPVTGIASLADGNCIISVDSGKVWSPLPTGNTETLTGACVIPGKWFVTGANGTILLSTNNGANWLPFTTGTTETFNGSHFSATNNGFAVGTNGTIQKYDGVSWTPETSGITEHLHNVYALSNGNAIAVGDNQTILSYNGSTWSPQASPLNFNVKDVRFADLLNGYAAGSGGIVLQTNDGGANWLPSLTGVGIDFNSVEVAGADTAWATGTDGIVYKTIDNGNNWVRYSVGYTDDQNQLRVTSGGKGHIVGHGGHGRYFNNNDSTNVITGNILTGSSLEKFNIYPNPARDQFTISGYLFSSEKVTIDLRDAQAKLVKQIVNTTFAGDYAESVSTEYYSPGIYFIHIKIGEKSMVKKLVVMK